MTHVGIRMMAQGIQTRERERTGNSTARIRPNLGTFQKEALAFQNGKQKNRKKGEGEQCQRVGAADSAWRGVTAVVVAAVVNTSRNGRIGSRDSRLWHLNICAPARQKLVWHARSSRCEIPPNQQYNREKPSGGDRQDGVHSSEQM